MRAKITPEPVNGEAICREPAETLPLCDDLGGNTYRALIGRYPPDVTTFDLLPKNTYPADNMLNPTPDSIRVFEDRYHPSEMCQRPDAARPGQYAVYARFANPQEVSRGGRGEAYEVEQCSRFQTTLRAFYCPVDGTDGSSYEICAVHYLSAAPAGALDPNDDDLPQQMLGALKSLGAEDICQMRVSNVPDRHGLFLALDQDLLAELEAQKMDSSMDAGTLAETVRDSLPDAVKACLPPIEDEKMAAAWTDEINEISDDIGYEEKISFKKELAVQIATQVSNNFAPGGLNEAAFSQLARTISFALAGGMEPHEVEKLAVNIGSRVSSSGDFLRHMKILLNLRVAQVLNSGPGGRQISKDFNDFIDSISAAIMSGDIRIRGKSFAEAFRMPMAFAFFNPESGEIVLNGKTSISNTFLATVHEAYHAYQYLNNSQKNIVEIELEAWERSTKASFLLATALSSGKATMAQWEALNEEFMNQTAFDAKLKGGRLDCVGFPPHLQKYWGDAAKYTTDSTQRWHQTLMAEFATGSSGYSREIFRSMYRMANRTMLDENMLSIFLAQYGKYYETGELDRTYFPEEGVWQAMQQKLKVLKSAPLKSTERAFAAQDFLNTCFGYAAMASYIEPTLVEKILDYYYQNYIEVEDALTYFQPMSH